MPVSTSRAERGRRVTWRPLLAGLSALAACAPANAEQPAQPVAAEIGQVILKGYRRYNSACNHCHGPDGVGSTFAPSLIEQPLPFARFEQIVRDGSVTGTSVMRGFADDPNVSPYLRDIYAYLEARVTGAVGRGRPTPAP
jgi:mono/diheme cytochrome c family protein